MGRPRKTPSPLEVEAKEFLEQKLEEERVLTVKDTVAATLLGALLSRSSGLVDDNHLRELKRTAYHYADKFLED